MVTFGLKLQFLEQITAEENADTCAGHRDSAAVQVRLRFANTELSLQIFGQEHQEAGHDAQLHAGAQTRQNVHGIGQQ